MNFFINSFIIFGVWIQFIYSYRWDLIKSEVNSNYKHTYLFLQKEEKFIPRMKNKPSNIIPSLLLQKEVTFDSANDIFHIRIIDPKRKHYRVPQNIFVSEQKDFSDIYSNGYVINDSKNPMNFKIKNKNNNTIFSFISENLVYSKFYISFSYSLTTDQIFGYGERVHNFKLSPGMYTIWLNDTGTPVDDGLGGKGLYGHHPFILNRVNDGSFIGILFVNTNAQDLIISKPNDDGTVDLNQITIGGEIEFFIFIGQTPNEVISNYQSKIGFPNLPPFWALGYHQCRWGYKNTSMLENIVNQFNNYSIPFDTIWSDIDYMESFEDFTVEQKGFFNLSATVTKFHNDNLHYVPIVDIGVAIKNGSYYNDLGKQLNTFIKSNYSLNPLINIVWPGYCYFPDFTNPNASSFWTNGLSNLSKLVPFDGIWLDMNEPGMFVNGETNVTMDPMKNKYEYLPYMPGGGNADLTSHSCSLNALMYGTGDQEFGTLYNFKPLNPHYENQITSQFFSNNNKRPFVLSRASMFGTGKFSNHWLGDNYSTLDSMIVSIPGIFNFQMFGFNLVGADICGFGGNTTDQLCSRWTDLGAFYPFSRNHNANDTISQEPWTLGNLTMKSILKSLRLRYSLLRYMYTQMFFSSLSGGAFFQPIFFQFPNDTLSYNYIDRQFMLGDSLLVSPILSITEDNITAYFPNANWNEFPGGKIQSNFNSSSVSGQIYQLPGKFNTLNIHMRGGMIIPFQNATANNITRSNGLLNINTSLYVNPDQNKTAFGKVVFDDGISFDTISKKNYAMIKFNLLQNGTLSFTTVNDFISPYSNQDINADKIIILRGNSFYKNAVAKDKSGRAITIKSELDIISDIFTITFPPNTNYTSIDSINFSN